MNPRHSPEMIRVDGVDIAATRVGDGPRVVCLHSVGHDARDFDALARRCGGFELICPDWPGHGQSGPDHAPASAERYEQILDGILAELGVINPILLGNSIGGAAAIRYARRRPVRGLVLCDSGGLVPVNRAVRIFCGAFERFFAAGERGASWFHPAFALYYRFVLTQPAARGRRREIIDSGRRMAPLLRQAWASFAKPEADLRDAAARIAAPIWVAWAKSDRVIPLSMIRPALARMAHARLTVFEGGHTPFLEQPDAFATAFMGAVTHW
jgi:4,5:9,10-diseco-3-hydroxy-5,9,17-trioxoandrosta-1(10),2-diene-4-oate hydrolase